MLALHPGRDSEPFRRALSVVEVHYAADWDASRVAWLLRCLGDAGLPAELGLVARCLADLEGKQRPARNIRTRALNRLAGSSKWGIIAALQNDQTGEVGTDMKVTTERLENCQVNVFVELDAADVEKELRQTARKLSRNYNVPGYRRGRAPYNAVIRIFGREAVQQQALEDFGQDLYDKAMEEIEYEPYEAGELADVEWDPFRMTILLPIRPEVDLGDYRAVRVAYEPEPVTDEDLDARLKQIQREHGQWVPVERPAAFGDQVVVDMEGKAGDELITSNKEREMVLQDGSRIPLPGFHEEVVGMSPAEEKTFTLTVPEHDYEESVAGQEATVTVHLHTVREEDLPALDDDLAMMVGDYDSLDDLRAALREEMETAELQQAEAEYLDNVLDAMIESAVKIEYPPLAIDREANLVLGQMERNLAMSGLQLDTYLGMIGKNRESYRQELRPVAEDRLQKRLVLDRVAEAEGLEADPDEVDAEIDRLSEVAGEESEQMRAMLESPEGRLSIASDLILTQAQERVIQIGKGEIETEVEAEVEAETEVEEVEAGAEVEIEAEVEVEAETEVEEVEAGAEVEIEAEVEVEAEAEVAEVEVEVEAEVEMAEAGEEEPVAEAGTEEAD
jgi:trigger factor